TPGEDQQDRPRTLKEALARQPDNQLPARKMKQDGGVKRARAISSLDVAATEFGAYDAALERAIVSRWLGLLDSRNFSGEGVGKVVVQFRLNADGSVSEVRFGET